MGWGSKVDPATGRKKRETGGMKRNQANREEGRNSGGIRRQNGAPAERRVDYRRRQVTLRQRRP
jgi:hypothetical protein